MTRTFVRTYGVDLDEATGSLADYPTLDALFTRELKPGARPVDDAPDALVSPVDGTVAAVGRTMGGEIEIAPGRMLDIRALLGAETRGEGWTVAVLYLSPKDYHRVHVAREGLATHWSYLPGTLWPVFPAAVRRVDHLFSRNERLTVTMQTAAGPLHTVLVGAFGVGRIEVGLADRMANDGAEATSAVLETPVSLERGGWLGTFHLGSTVILAAPPESLDWSVTVGETVRMGRRIATVVGDC